MYNPSKNSTSRLDYIDIAKGIGIILIVLGHSISGDRLFCQWIYMFHVPLFFFLSGFTYNNDKYPYFQSFLKKRAKQLLLPSFNFTLITLVVAKCFVPEFYSFRSILYGLPHAMWFLPVLLIVEAMYHPIGKLKSEKTKSFCMIISILFGTFLFRYGFHIPYRIDTVFLGLFYYGIGNIVRNTSMNNVLFDIKDTIVLGGVIVVTLLAPLIFVYYVQNTIQFWNNEMPKPEILSIVLSLSGIYGILLLSAKISSVIKKVFVYIGKNTLTVLCVHMLYISLFRHYLDYTTDRLHFVLIEQVLLCITLYFTIAFVNKKCPFLIGKK